MPGPSQALAAGQLDGLQSALGLGRGKTHTLCVYDEN